MSFEDSLPPSLKLLKPADKSWPVCKKGRAAAVCMLFIRPKSAPFGAAHIVLTKRTTHLSTHKGQVGFPGGKKDPEDISPTDTALRELEEEIGLKREKVFVHGQLEASYSLGGGLVIPIVASTRESCAALTPNPYEVAELFTAPWTAFSQENSEVFSFNLFGLQRKSHHFRVEDYTVWGLTAKILYESGLR